MDPALANALKRRNELKKELEKLDQFINMYHELAGTNREELDMQPYEISATEAMRDAAGMIRPRGRPGDFARIMETVLKDFGHPLQRGQLVDEVEKRGHLIPSEDKPRYLGTILWRNNEMFESIEGRGYWLKGVLVPPVQVGELL